MEVKERLRQLGQKEKRECKGKVKGARKRGKGNSGNPAMGWRGTEGDQYQKRKLRPHVGRRKRA